jgi:hypothetical protein
MTVATNCSASLNSDPNKTPPLSFRALATSQLWACVFRLGNAPLGRVVADGPVGALTRGLNQDLYDRKCDHVDLVLGH